MLKPRMNTEIRNLASMKFTILKRLVFGYMAIMLLVFLMGGYVTIKLNDLNEMIKNAASVDVTAVRRIEILLDTLLSQVGFEKKYLISGDLDFYFQFHKAKERFENSADKVQSLLKANRQKNMFLESKKLYDRYLSLFEEEIILRNRGKKYSSEQYQGEREKITRKIIQTLGEIIVMVSRDRDDKIISSNRVSYRVLRVSTITVGLTIILGILISILNTRSINRPIKRLKEQVREIAAGRFVEIEDIASPPEIKELTHDFNAMSERLRELDQMKLDFISHVSHELRTPLTAIKEASSLLLEEKIVNSPESRRELILIIGEECERLISAVNKILDLSRMEASMMDYRFRRSSLEAVIQKTVLKLAPIAQKKEIDLELKPLPLLPPVRIDEERITQVLENLLGNALKYTPLRGRIIIRAAVVERNRKYILVGVSDSGPGIPRKDMKNIFDKFQRLDYDRETARGTGLGLSIAKHIITDHGGKIWVKSRAGKGSTFFFLLPVS